MSQQYFGYAGLGMGLLAGYFGINAALQPEKLMKDLGIPVLSQLEARKNGRTLMRFLGVKNMTVAYLLILLWSTGDQKLLGLGMVGLAGMAFGDGLVSKTQLGNGEWNHWTMVPIVGGIAAGLLGWLRL
ncbi:hypothetical protein BX600DRAFT_460481 [Xylariales sp. PMI_506]|nr:hypothetical protein BX600DRAFT_460481 [Xylariales sp. PMI_506]